MSEPLVVSKLYECDGASCTKMIFSGSQRLVAKPVGQSTLYFYHGDHLGSTSVVTDNTGTQVEALTYYPFGQTRTNVPGTPVNVAHKYTGKELDNATGLYFYEARYYDAILCRFISADTLVGNPKDPQDLNRYGYARNNPLKYTDPTGHFFDPVTIAIVVAAVAGGVAAGIQSDWNPKAVALGVAIGAASGAAGGAAGVAVSSAAGGGGAGIVAGGIVGGMVGGLTSATMNQLAGNKANWGPSIAYGGAAGGVGAGVGAGANALTGGEYLTASAIAGGLAGGAARAGMSGGNILKGALMNAGVAAVTSYLVVEYGTSPAEAQAAAQASRNERALLVAASETVCDIPCPLVSGHVSVTEAKIQSPLPGASGGTGDAVGSMAGAVIGARAGAEVGTDLGINIGFRIGGALGLGAGPLGSLGGAILGGFVGQYVGGFFGGMAGAQVGGQIGGMFDSPCAGQVNCGERVPGLP